MQQKGGYISRPNQIYFSGLMVGLLLLSIGVRLVFLNNFEWDYDEGIHVLLARLLATGYKPYQELFVSYPPLFVWSLEWSWRIWRSIAAIQLTMAGFSTLGLVAVGRMAFRLGGWFAGLASAFILSFSATYLAGSVAVMTEVPSVSMATLAVALGAGYYWSGRRRWLLGSGLAMSASLMLKILSPFVLGLAPLMIIVHQLEQQKSWGRRLKNIFVACSIWFAALLGPILLVLLFYDAQAMYRQVIAFRFDTRTAYRDDWSENIGMVLAFGRVNLPLVGAVVWGTGIIIYKRWRTGWFVLLWLVLAFTFSMLQVPLREKHLPLLLPPMAVLAGIGLGAGWQTAIVGLRHGQPRLALVSLIVAGSLTVAYLWQTGNEFVTFQHSTTVPLNENDRMLAEYLQRFTAPNDCLVTDNPTLAFFAEKLVPPKLSEVSSARLRSGYLTYRKLVQATEQYNCQVVAPVAKRLHRTRHDFVEWSAGQFLGLWLYDGATEVLLAQPLAEPQPSHPVQVTLANQVVLVGFDLLAQEGESDQTQYLSLYWRTLQPFEKDYTIFVHLRDGANNMIANADHQAYNGLVPTSVWPVGQAVKETIRLDLPPDLPEGVYQIMVGMYLVDTLERLPVQNDTTGENAVPLISLRIHRNKGKMYATIPTVEINN